MGSYPTIDVIEISSPEGGLMTIAASDFDPALHVMPGDPIPAVPKKRGRPRKIKEGT